MDTDGNKMLSKYYNKGAAAKEEAAFERELFSKTNKQTNEVILFKDKLITYKWTNDLMIYLIGSVDENELMLNSVLNGLIEALMILLRNQIEKTSFIENLDMVLLALDETIDDGIVLETDATAIASRVSRPKADTNEIQINEQTLFRAFDLVKDRVSKIQL